MSRTIDERIVQMTFQNKDFEKNANKTIGTLDKLKSSLNFKKEEQSLDDLERTANKINFTGLNDSLSKVGHSFSVLEVAAVTAIANISNRITNLGVGLVKSLSIDQISAGWQKFNQTVMSQQTIMSAVSSKINAATGLNYTMDDVIERIDKLALYSDETSYSLAQMTEAIGSFTSSGIDLDEATQMVMGIANAAATAGVDSIKAASAFIGFSKAIGAGAMTLGVWNNQMKTSGLTNSEAFKQSLIDAAVAEKTLVKVRDGLYRSVETGEEVTIANFTQTMTEGKWLNSAAMTRALKEYSETVDAVFERVNKGEFDTVSEAIRAMKDEYIAAGKEIPKSLEAFSKAQEAISFRQAVESARDATATKWSKTYELIFGNYEEGKTLWTKLSEEMWTWFAEPQNNLNKALSAWHSDEIINDAIEREYDNEIKNLPKQLYEATKSLTAKRPETGYEVFVDSLTQVMDNITTIVETIRNAFRKIFGEISADDLRIWTLNFEKLVNSLTLSEDSLNGIENILKGIFSIVNIIKTTIGNIFSYFVVPLVGKFKPIFEDIFEIFQNIAFVFTDFSKETENASSVFESFLGKALDILDPFINGIKAITEWIRDLTEAWKQNAAAGSYSFSVFKVISGIFTNISSFLKDIPNILSNIFSGIKTVFDKIWGYISPIVEKIKGIFTDTMKSNDLNAFGFAGLLIALEKLMNVKWFGDQLSLLKEIFTNFWETVIYTIDDLQWNLETGAWKNYADLFKNIAISLLILAGALAIIASIDDNSLDRALSTIALITGLLVGVFALLKKTRSSGGLSNVMRDLPAITNMVGGLLAISTSIMILAIALKKLSSIDPDKLGTSLLALAGIMGGLYLFMLGVSKMGKVNIGSGLVAMAASIWIMAKALGSITKTISNNTSESVLGAVAIMGAILGEIWLMLYGLKDIPASKILSIGISMNLMAISLGALSLVMHILKSLSPEESGNALLALGILLGSIFAFSALMNKNVSAGNFAAISASMLLLAPAILVLSMAFKALGKMKLENVGKALLGLGGSLLAIFAFAAGIHHLGGGSINFAILSAGLILMSTALVIMSGALMMLGTMDLDSIRVALIGLAGGLIIIGGLGILFGTLSPLIMKFSLAMAMFGAALLLTAKAIMLISATGAVFGEFTSSISGDIFNMIIAVTASVIEVLPGILFGIVEAIANTLIHFFEYFDVGGLVISLVHFLINALNGLAEMIRTESYDIGSAIGNLIEALLEGILKAAAGLLEGFGEKFIRLIYDEEWANDMKSWNHVGKVVGKQAKAVTEEVVDEMNKGAEVNSPSKATFETGENIMDGLINGIKSKISETADTSYGAGGMVINALRNAFAKPDIFAETDLNPVITPVLDLTNLEEGSSQINDMFGNNQTLALAGGIGGIGGFNQNSITLNNTFNITNGDNITKDTVAEWEDWLIDDINNRLGRRV